MKIEKPLKHYFSQEFHYRVILAGCGGTGSFIAQDIARIAYHLKNKPMCPRIVFVDNDTVEAKNVGRQNFVESEIGKSKAQVLALRYNRAYGLDIEYFYDGIDKYPDLLDYSFSAIVIGAVDNTRARGIIASAFSKTRRSTDFWLDCGNAKDSGQILIGNSGKQVKKEQEQLQKLGICLSIPYPHLQHEEIITKEKKPKLSCAELAQTGEQSLMVNRAIAVFAGQYLYDIFVKRELCQYATYISLGGKAVETKFLNKNIWEGK